MAVEVYLCRKRKDTTPKYDAFWEWYCLQCEPEGMIWHVALTTEPVYSVIEGDVCDCWLWCDDH